MNYQASMIFDTQLGSKQSKIPMGIHAGAQVTNIERGENFVDIHFKDAEDRVHNKRLWDANGNYPRKDKAGNFIETKQEAIEREEQSNLAHIVKLVHIFGGDQALQKLGGDYDEFIDKAIKMLKPLLPTKKVNLKLIYDSEGIYSKFGTFPDYVEEYVEGQEPRLKFNKWELDNCTTYKGEPSAPATGISTQAKLAELY